LIGLAAVIIVIVMFFSTVSVESEEADANATPVQSGSCGGGISWYLYDGGYLVLLKKGSGDGVMNDFPDSGGPWGTSVKNIYIGEGITAIGKNAFRGQKVSEDSSESNKTLVLPEGLKRIGEMAFYECEYLVHYLSIPDSVETIEAQAFDECEFEVIFMGSGLKDVSRSAFGGERFYNKKPWYKADDLVWGKKSYVIYTDKSYSLEKLRGVVWRHDDGDMYDSGTDYCIVTFDYNGHGVPVLPQIIEVDEKAKVPTSPSESGYFFDGWYVGDNYFIPWDFRNEVGGNLSLIAMWTQDRSDGNYTVNSWGGMKRAVENIGNSKTIILNRDISAVNEWDGGLEINGKNLTIDLNGNDIDMKSSWKNDKGVFTIKGGASVTIMDSTGRGSIKGGNTENGGAIRVDSQSRITLNNVNIASNYAVNGGGLYSEGTATLTDVRFSYNGADNNGGAVYNTGNLTIGGSKFTGNTAKKDGGALYASGTTTITDSTFTGNSVTKSGGAIRISGGTVSIDGSSLTWNRAVEDHGGAVYMNDSTSVLRLNNTVITDNEAGKSAGAIYYGTTDSSLYLKGKQTIKDNIAPTGRNILICNEPIHFDGNLTDDSVIHLSSQSSATVQYSDTETPYIECVKRQLTDDIPETHKTIFKYDGFDNLIGGQLHNTETAYENGKLWLKVSGAYYVDSWSGLQSYVNSTNAQRIVLTTNIYANGKDRIVVDDRIVEIDLNGFTLDRQRSSNGSNGHVFELKGHSTLTLIDSAGTGEVTGGYATHGGGIHIHEDASCIIIGAAVLGNNAGSDGGGIYVRGSLKMYGGAVSSNTSGDTAGGIYVNESGTLYLKDTLVSNNTTKNDGGGLILHLHEDTTIDGCYIAYNVSRTEDGGAMRIEASDHMLTINDTVIKGNNCENDGGAIVIYSGSLCMNSCQVSGNSAEKGGALHSDGSPIELTNCVLENNYASKDGGAIYSEGVLTFNSGRINSNTAGERGGGIYLEDNDGVTHINGGEIKYNYAGKDGGGIYVNDDGKLYLTSGTVTENTAEIAGGGVYISDDANGVGVYGNPVVSGNYATQGNGILLNGDKPVYVDGVLTEGAAISLPGLDTKVTSGYSTHNSGKDPSLFFLSDDGYNTVLKDGEVSFSIATLIDTEGTFISVYDTIRDYKDVNSKNWMSAISGDRKLNEINIPGTHDSAMKKTESRSMGSGGHFFSMDELAITQKRFIDEQLEDGVRLFDLRLNTHHLVKAGTMAQIGYFITAGFYEFFLTDKDGLLYVEDDDDKNLWLCHGKTSFGGTFYAQDHDGDDLSLKKVLDWYKDFLRKHPTETLIVEFNAEIEGGEDGENDRAFERLKGILSELSKEINPSTGKSYLYMQDGVFGKQYYDYPYLRDCRGQIVILCKEYDGIGGIRNYQFDGKYTTRSQSAGYDTDADNKIESIKEFFAEYGDTMVPDLGQEFDVLYTLGTNVAPPGTGYFIGSWFKKLVFIDVGPSELAQGILDELFCKGGEFDHPGRYVGWVRTDGAEAKHVAYIWKDNFYDGLHYYTLNVSDGNSIVQSYRLQAGTEITMPYSIFPHTGDDVFVGWSTGETTYSPGKTCILNSDLTVTPIWMAETVLVESLIDSIGTVEYSAKCERSIQEARNAYDLLEEEKKAGVSNYQTLVEAESTFNSLEQANTKFKVTFESNGGTEVDWQLVGGGYRVDPKVTVKIGYTFVAWCKDSTFESRYDFTYPVTESFTLYAAWASQEDKTAAYAAVQKIDAIGVVTYTDDCEDRIVAAEDQYRGLTHIQKMLVTNLTVLFNAHMTYELLEATYEEDTARANEVKTLIAQIGTVEYTKECKDRIDIAVNAYNLLSEHQRGYVSSDETEAMANAQFAYMELQRISNVIRAIDSIGEVAYTTKCKNKIDTARGMYDALSDAQKASVDNYSVLTTAESTYLMLKAEIDEAESNARADRAAISEVVGLIDDIGVVYYPASYGRIADARAAYDALSEEQKGQVGNYGKLTAAEATYSNMRQNDQNAVQTTIELISVIGEVLYPDSKSAIGAARTNYDSLTSDQKAEVTNYATLTAAEATYNGWTSQSYTISFVKEDDTSISSASYPYGTHAASITVPSAPGKEGYSFSGWSPAIVDVTKNAVYKVTYSHTTVAYSVKFVDDDGTTELKAAINYASGTPASKIIMPADPTKQSTASRTYEFTGWSPAIVDVTKNAVYKATYAEEAVTYVVTVDLNGGESTIVKEGSIWEYDEHTSKWETRLVYGAVPDLGIITKEGQYFNEWSPAITAVTGDVSYTATYSSEPKKYNVIWKDCDGNVLETDENVAYNTLPQYDGETPAKASTVRYSYEFTGWSPEVTKVTGDVTYTAVMNTYTNKFTVTWKNYDGTVLEVNDSAEYGSTPTCG